MSFRKHKVNNFVIKPYLSSTITLLTKSLKICSLYSINEIKQLFINVKRDYKFLRRFMNDVRDYVELMEEAAAVGK